MRQHLEEFVTRHQFALLCSPTASPMQAVSMPASLNRWLQQSHSIYPGFQTLTVADKEGIPIAISPQFAAGRQPGSLSGKRPTWMSARPCVTANIFACTMASPRTLGYFRSLSLAARPISPSYRITAPLFAPKRRFARGSGGIAAALALSRHSARTIKTSGRRVDLLILDQRDRVIYSNRPADHPPLDSLEHSALVEASLRGSRDTRLCSLDQQEAG